MPAIYIAANHIGITGGLDYGHLQLVYDDGTTLTEIEVQAPWNGPAGQWIFEDERDHSSNTPYYGIQGYYTSVELNLGGRSAGDVWDAFVGIHNQFILSSPAIEYDFYKNSNSYITTLLARLGVDVSDYMPNLLASEIDDLPGAGNDVLSTALDSIPLVIEGTDGIDRLIGGAASDSISGAGETTRFKAMSLISVISERRTERGTICSEEQDMTTTPSAVKSLPARQACLISRVVMRPTSSSTIRYSITPIG